MKTDWFTLEQRQDVRSLAAFRILAGTYLICDILSRLQHGRFSLLWYTSTENSFLLPDDTPHRSPVHRIWFYRGSEFFQLTLFAITFLLAISFTAGYKCNGVTKTLLWLNVVAMQCRCMPPHDGSDTYFRHLLLWSIQLPMSQVWSVDSARSNSNQQLPGKNKSNVQKSIHLRNLHHCTIQNRAAVWGIRLQIVFMYLGTVMNRTIDKYGLAIYKSQWLPPQLTAVHYALNGSLATRECWLGDLVRTNLLVSQIMTLMAMLMEGFAPLFCLIMGDKTHIPAFFLFKIHFGLLVLMNLPNWQIIGMIASVIWLPSWVWDDLQRSLSLKYPNFVTPPRIPISQKSMQKKDMVPATNVSEGEMSGGVSFRNNRRRRPFLTYFFLSYMVLDFAGNRNWIRKFDQGDIGEFLRFSQYWVMFSGPGATTSQVMITGTLGDNANVNVWEWIKSGNDKEIVDMEAFQKEILTNMTHVYPSPRIERAFADWPSKKGSAARTEHFLGSLCECTPFNHLRMTSQILNIMPPGSEKRYSRNFPDTVVEVKC